MKYKTFKFWYDLLIVIVLFSPFVISLFLMYVFSNPIFILLVLISPLLCVYIFSFYNPYKSFVNKKMILIKGFVLEILENKNLCIEKGITRLREENIVLRTKIMKRLIK